MMSSMRLSSILLLAVTCTFFNQAFAGLGLSRSPPCRQGQTSGCDNTRFKPCGTISPGSVSLVVSQNANLNCGSQKVDPYDTNRWILVQFDGSDGCTEIKMKSGECWGTTPSGDYDCLGRCGGGCASWSCSNWGPNCLQHDVCSYYYGASGGGSDPNCGDEYGYAVDDTVRICFWPWQNSCEADDHSIAGSRTAAICN